jgi:hypothetical protein
MSTQIFARVSANVYGGFVMISRAVEKYYSPREAGFLLGFEERWVRDRIKAGELPGTTEIGGEYRIPASAINAKIEAGLVRGPGELGTSARSVGELRRKVGLRRGSGGSAG